MKTALYAGTFDPFTNGHFDIVKRSLHLFDKLILLIAVSPNKKPFLSLEDRLASLKMLFANESKVEIDSWSGLVVEYARQKKIDALVRGLRPTGDFEAEFQMASMNNYLNSEVETVFLVTSSKYYYISSSVVKEVFLHGGNIERFVPVPILETLKKITLK